MDEDNVKLARKIWDVLVEKKNPPTADTYIQFLIYLNIPLSEMDKLNIEQAWNMSRAPGSPISTIPMKFGTIGSGLTFGGQGYGFIYFYYKDIYPNKPLVHYLMSRADQPQEQQQQQQETPEQLRAKMQEQMDAEAARRLRQPEGRVRSEGFAFKPPSEEKIRAAKLQKLAEEQERVDAEAAKRLRQPEGRVRSEGFAFKPLTKAELLAKKQEQIDAEYGEKLSKEPRDLSDVLRFLQPQPEVVVPAVDPRRAAVEDTSVADLTPCPSREIEPTKPTNMKDFRDQSKIFHPDVNPGCIEDATRKMSALNSFLGQFGGRMSKHSKSKRSKSKRSKSKHSKSKHSKSKHSKSKHSKSKRSKSKHSKSKPKKTTKHKH